MTNGSTPAGNEEPRATPATGVEDERGQLPPPRPRSSFFDIVLNPPSDSSGSSEEDENQLASTAASDLARTTPMTSSMPTQSM